MAGITPAETWGSISGIIINLLYHQSLQEITLHAGGADALAHLWALQ